MSKIIVYTDGGVRGNGNKENLGAYGVVILENNMPTIKIKEPYCNVTNNQMELQAVIEGLKHIREDKKLTVEVHSDSKYIVNCMNEKWYKRWRFNGWKTTSGSSVKNKEQWLQLLQLRDKFKDVNFVWCKGHNGDKYNEMCDQLVNKAMDATKGVI